MRAVRGGLCINAPVPAQIMNRVVAVTDDLDLDEVAAVYAVPHDVTVAPGAETVEERLAARGYTRGEPWVKLARDAAPAPAVRSELRIERTHDEAMLGRTLAEGFGSPSGAPFHVLSRPGFSGFLAWAGDEPAGGALLYVDGALAWFGATATRPAFRGRGAQTALLAARIEHARAAGAATLTVETAPEGSSNRNVRAAGFDEAYVRANWRSPA